MDLVKTGAKRKDKKMTKVYVVMGNDFPDAIFSTQAGAEQYCEKKKSENKHIYWLEFELRTERIKSSPCRICDTMIEYQDTNKRYLCDSPKCRIISLANAVLKGQGKLTPRIRERMTAAGVTEKDLRGHKYVKPVRKPPESFDVYWAKQLHALGLKGGN
jgi:hypothetical protein